MVHFIILKSHWHTPALWFLYEQGHQFIYSPLNIIYPIVKARKISHSSCNTYRRNKTRKVLLKVYTYCPCPSDIRLHTSALDLPDVSNSRKVAVFFWAYALLAQEAVPVARTQELVLCWPREGSNSLVSSPSTNTLPSVQQGKHTRLNYRQMPMH